MLIECVFEDVQPQGLVEVFEENLAQVIAFADDDGILGRKLIKMSKGGTKHGVGRNVPESTLFIELLQARFNGGNVAQNTLLRQHREYLAKGIECIFHRGSIDHQFGLEGLNLLQSGEAVGVIDKT